MKIKRTFLTFLFIVPIVTSPMFISFSCNNNWNKIIDNFQISLKNKQQNVEDVTKDDFNLTYDKSLAKVEISSIKKFNDTSVIVSVTFYDFDNNVVGKRDYLVSGFIPMSELIKDFQIDVKEKDKKYASDIASKYKNNVTKEKLLEDFLISGIDETKVDWKIERVENLGNGTIEVLLSFFDKINNKNIGTRKYKISGFKKESEILRWGHWNICNLGNLPKHQVHANLIANWLASYDIDVMGLTEVESMQGLEEIVKKLNEFKKTKKFKHITSKRLKGVYAGKNQAEYTSIIYNSTKLEVKDFTNGKKGFSYQEKFKSKWRDDCEYVRPPFGALFEHKNSSRKFTFVFNHFDGPGINPKINEVSSGYGGNGSQEVAEAMHLRKVLDKFDELDGDNENIFFGGDTNIKLGNQRKGAFDDIEQKGYKSLFKDEEKYKSSLGANFNVYSQPYDKLFAKTKFQTIGSYIYKLWDIEKDKELLNKCKDLGLSYDSSPRKWHAQISDHCPVYSDLKF